MITVCSITSLAERHRRALALLASMACPSTEWPRALVLIGLTSIDEALGPKRLVGVFWCAAGEADGVVSSPTLAEYMHTGTPVVVLARAFSDAQAIAAALQRECAA